MTETNQPKNAPTSHSEQDLFDMAGLIGRRDVVTSTVPGTGAMHKKEVVVMEVSDIVEFARLLGALPPPDDAEADVSPRRRFTDQLRERAQASLNAAQQAPRAHAPDEFEGQLTQLRSEVSSLKKERDILRSGVVRLRSSMEQLLLTIGLMTDQKK